MMSWDPGRYLHYEDARLRPALDLLARVPVETPAEVVDLGCGAGNVSRHLAARWPQARIEGVDADVAMLAQARASAAGDPRFAWTLCDLAAWRPRAAVDVVYSNAALHWLDDHACLFAELFAAVAPGGALAVQMPDNFAAASHRLPFDAAASPRWRDRLARHVRRTPVAALADYRGWLAPPASALDLWATEYLQGLPARADGEHPVVAWMQGTALLPFLGALAGADRGAFVADYAALVEEAYPRRADGSVLFAFRRVFVVATRRHAAHA